MKKETVVLISKDKRSTSVFEEIKSELLKSESIEVVRLEKDAVESRNQKLIKRFAVPLLKIKDTFNNVIGKTTKVSFGTSVCSKRIVNLFYRYTPILVFTDSPDVLVAIEKNKGKLGTRTHIVAFCPEITFDIKLVNDIVKYYFVDNIEARNKLVYNGIYSDKIFVDPVPCEKKYFESYDKEEARNRYFRNNGNKKVVIDAECSDKKYRELISLVDENFKGTDILIYAGINTKAYKTATEKGAAVFDKNADKFDIFASADIIVSQGDTLTVKSVSAMNKPLIIYKPSDKIKVSNAEYLRADNSVAFACNAEEFKTILDSFDNGTLNLKNDFTDAKSASNIAKEILNIINLSE